MKDLLKSLPFWTKISVQQQETLQNAATELHYKKGSLLHRGDSDCVGLFLVQSGQLRVYTLSEEGRELTLYRLFARDMCLLSASCILQGLQFDVFVSATEETQVLHIPSPIYATLMEQSIAVSNYTNEVMASHFSEVMWLMDQIMNKKLDARIAAFLLEESALAQSVELRLTHEQIARHLGSAREVVTRMLKHFQTEGLLQLGRGNITLEDTQALSRLAAG